MLERKAELVVAEEGKCKERRVSLITRRDDLKLIVEKEKGKHVLELEKALEKIGVDRGQYHGGAFTGNMVDKVLQGYPVLLEPIKEDVALHQSFTEIFGILKELKLLLYAPRILSDKEIEDVLKLCDAFGKTYPVKFHGSSITRKMHNLTHKVPRFVKRWKSVGMFAEQASESTHNAFNQEGRTFTSVKSKSQKLVLLMRAQERRIGADLTQSLPISRVCARCRPSRFFKRTVNGVKICPNCHN